MNASLFIAAGNKISGNYFMNDKFLLKLYFPNVLYPRVRFTQNCQLQLATYSYVDLQVIRIETNDFLFKLAAAIR